MPPLSEKTGPKKTGPKKLSSLGLTARLGRDPVLTGITLDSRAVRPGYLFAAMPGTTVHGAAYITTALTQGAAAILTDAAGPDLPPMP